MEDIESVSDAPQSFRSKVNAVDQWGNTALHYAASKGDTDEVARLIEDGANCNAASLDGSTAMHCAAARNCASIVELLMTKGASPAAMDKHGRSPLALAVQLGHMDLAKNTFLRAERRTNPDSPSAEERRAARTPGQALPFGSSASLRAVSLVANTTGESMESLSTIRKQLVFEEGGSAPSLAAITADATAAADGDVFNITEETGADLAFADGAPSRAEGGDGAGAGAGAGADYSNTAAAAEGALDSDRSRSRSLSSSPTPALYTSSARASPTGKGAVGQYRQRGMSGYSVPRPCKLDDSAIETARGVCETGDIKLLKAMVENDLDLVEKCDKDGNSLIHICAALDQEALLKFLLAAGCHPCYRNKRGQTALHIAALRGHYQLVHTFVSDFGAPNLLIRDRHGSNPLHSAVQEGHNSIVELIIDCAADDPVRGNAVLTALDVQYRSPADLATALNNRNAASMLQQAASWHQNYAMGRGFVSDRMANIQVQRNSDDGLGGLTDEQVERQQSQNMQRGFGKVTDHQKTRLLTSMREDGDPTAVREYIACNGKPNTIANTYAAKTPMHLCSEAGSQEAVLVLLKADGDPNQLCRWKFWGAKRATSPLHLAVESGSINTITTLLDGGADINFANKTTGDNALHMALVYGRARIVATLLKYGADVFVQTKLKMNAIAVANKHQHPECMALLEPAAFEALAWSSDAEALFTCLKENAGLAEPGIAALPQKTLISKLLQFEALLVVVYQSIPRSVEITPVQSGHQQFLAEALSTYESWEDSQKSTTPDSTDGNFHLRAAVARDAIRGLLDATIAMMQIIEGQIESPIDKLKKGGKKTMRCYRYILDLYEVRPTPERKLTDTEKYAIVQKVKKGEMTMVEAEEIMNAAKRADDMVASAALVEATKAVARANWKKWLKLPSNNNTNGNGAGKKDSDRLDSDAKRKRRIQRVQQSMRPHRSTESASSSASSGAGAGAADVDDSDDLDSHRGLDTDGEDENEYGSTRTPTSSSRSSVASVDQFVMIDAAESDARPRVQPGLSAASATVASASAAPEADAPSTTDDAPSTPTPAEKTPTTEATTPTRPAIAPTEAGNESDAAGTAATPPTPSSEFGAKAAWNGTLATNDSDDEDGNADLPAGWSQAPVSTTATPTIAATADDDADEKSAFYENSRGFVHRVPSIASAAAAGGGFGSFDAVVSATSAHGVKMAKSRDQDAAMELTDAQLLAQVLQRVENKQTEEEAARKAKELIETMAKEQQQEEEAAQKAKDLVETMAKEQQQEEEEQAQAAEANTQRLESIEQADKEVQEAKQAEAKSAAALDERRRHHRLLEQKDEEAAEEARKVLRLQREEEDVAEEKLRIKEETEEAERVEKAAALAASSSSDDDLVAKSSDSGGNGNGGGSDPLVAWLEAAKQADVEPAEDSIADMTAGPAVPCADASTMEDPRATIDNATIGHTAHLVADALQSLSVLDAVSDKMQKSASIDSAATAVTAEDEESGVIVEAESVPAPEMAAIDTNNNTNDDGNAVEKEEEEGNPFATTSEEGNPFATTDDAVTDVDVEVEVNPFMSTEDDDEFMSEDEFNADNEEWTLDTPFSNPATAARAAESAVSCSAAEDVGAEEATVVAEESSAAPAETVEESAVEIKEQVQEEDAAAPAETAAVEVEAEANIDAEAEKIIAAKAEAESLRIEVAKLTAQLESQAATPPTPPPSSEPVTPIALAETPYGTLEGNDDDDAMMADIALSDGESLASGQSSPARSISGASAAVLDLSSLVAAGGEAEVSAVAERKPKKKKKDKKKKREEKRKRIAAVESLAATDKDASNGGGGDKGRRSRSSSKSHKRRGSGTGASASESDASEVASPVPMSYSDGGAGAAVVGSLAASASGEAAAATSTTASSAVAGAGASDAVVEGEGNVMLEFVGYWGDTSRQLKISRVAENREDFMVEWVGSAHFDPSGITCMGGTPTENQGLKFDVHSKVGRSEWVLQLDVSAGRPVQHISGSAQNTRGDQATCTLRRYATADELPAMGKSGKRGFLLKAATSGLKGLAKSKMKQIASMEILKRTEDAVQRVDSKTVPNCVGKQMVRRPGEGLGLAVQAVKGEVGVRVAQVWPNTVAEGAGLTVGMVLVRVDGDDVLNSSYEQLVGALKEAASTFDIVVCNPADIAEAIKQREIGKAMKGAPAWWGGGGENGRPRSQSQSSSGSSASTDRPRSQSTSAGSTSSTATSPAAGSGAPPNMMADIPGDAPTEPAAAPADGAAAAGAAATMPALGPSSMPIVRCFHQVMPSDSFVGLSFKYGISVDTLRTCNKMSQSDQLFSRKRLMIPEEDL